MTKRFGRFEPRRHRFAPMPPKRRRAKIRRLVDPDERATGRMVHRLLTSTVRDHEDPGSIGLAQ